MNTEWTPKPTHGDPMAQRDMRELDRIEMINNRISTSIDRLGGFLARFHGSIPNAGDARGSGPTPVPSGYRGQIDELDRQVDALANLVEELTSLG